MHRPGTEFYSHSLNSPCKNCPSVGCGSYHSQCEKYLQFKADLEQAKARRKELDTISSFRGTKGLGNHYRPKRWTNKTSYFPL